MPARTAAQNDLSTGAVSSSGSTSRGGCSWPSSSPARNSEAATTTRGERLRRSARPRGRRRPYLTTKFTSLPGT